jgi:hypothetical protein
MSYSPYNYTISSLNQEFFTENIVLNEETARSFLTVNTDLSLVNPNDLQRITGLFSQLIDEKTTELNNINTSLNGNITNTPKFNLNKILDDLDPDKPNTPANRQKSMLDDLDPAKVGSSAFVQNTVQVTIQNLNTRKDGLLGNIGNLNLEVDRINQTIENLEAQFQQELANLIESKEDIIEIIKENVATFQSSINNVKSMFQNPIVNLYVNNGAKKQIPFKKKIKLFLTLNGKEQWKSPPSVQYLTISGLVSSRQKAGGQTPEFKSASRWKPVSKYFKPTLKKESDSVGGRWYLELDARKINDFPAGYWDEFVVRYDDPSGWSGEVFRWSWQDSGGTGVVGGDMLDTANELVENVNLLTEALDRFIDNR